MEIIEVKLSELKPTEYNPRIMSKKEAEDLKASIDKFGMVEPIVVNSAENRKNIIIGGHQRYNLLKEMGKETIPVFYVNLPSLEDEQELNLRLNKNNGHWDLEMLADLDEKLLTKVGFEELHKLFNIEVEKPDVEFTEELMESHNYIVLYFDNEMDWLQLQTLYPLKKVKALDSKEGFKKMGVGRVVKGRDFINKVKNES